MNVRVRIDHEAAAAHGYVRILHTHVPMHVEGVEPVPVLREPDAVVPGVAFFLHLDLGV